MKINSINIPKEALSDGLEAIKLDRFPDIVLVAGKNGAGKTRLFGNIKRLLYEKLQYTEIDSYYRKIETNQIEITKSQQLIDKNKQVIINNKQVNTVNNQSKHNFKISGFGFTSPKNIIEREEQKIISHSKENEDLNSRIKKDSLIILNSPLVMKLQFTNKVIDFVPKKIVLTDSSELIPNELYKYAKRCHNRGTEAISEGALAQIHIIQNRKFNATHPDSEISQEEKQQAKDNFDKLNGLIKQILQTEITRNINGVACLYGMEIGKAKLSDGQKVLLQLCVALYAQDANLEDVIVFMDEPENHLHPAALIEVIERLKACVTNGQIWIATHSVPLLAHFGPSNIYYMEDNKVSYAGDVPEKVLAGLLGDEDEIARLQDFTNLPAILAINKYAFECLFEPAVVMTDKNDPQTLQIKANIQHLMKNGKLKVLDYGAGKGRLLSNIIDSLDGETSEFIKAFDYIAFDKYDEDKADCVKLIEKVYGSAENRYFNDMNTLLTSHDKESFNVVIMCNVLHEIDPKEWLNLFKKTQGQIVSLLASDGILLHVEDTQMPIGEKAFQNGFIVLDTPHVKDLFNIKQESDTKFSVSTEKGGRLKAHQIPKECLERITSETKKKALQAISTTATDKIKDLRNKEKRDYKNGKIHAYWVQQLANTTLALSEID